jgi:hypothetical protein
MNSNLYVDSKIGATVTSGNAGNIRKIGGFSPPDPLNLLLVVSNTQMLQRLGEQL